MENTQNDYRNSIQWQPLIEIIVVMMTILGSTIPLYIHTDSKIDAIRESIEVGRKETNQLIEAIRQDMRDFHGRLCAIEERNKQK